MLDGLAPGVLEAWSRLVGGDPDVYEAVGISLQTSLLSTLAASLIGVPLGALLGTARFPGKQVVSTLLNTSMAVPTVVVGLLCYGFLSRSGPFGTLDLLYTWQAIVVGQTLLVIPIITVLTQAAFEQLDPRARMTLKTLGMPRLRSFRLLLGEARTGIMAAVVAAFGRAIGEVGVAMMLGGNIRAHTRTMTTAIALETSRGEFSLGVALGTILLCVALGTNVIFRILQTRGRAP